MDCKRPDDLQCSTTPNIDVALLMESLSRVAAGVRHCMEAVDFGKEDERLPTVLVAVVPGKPIQVIDVDEFQEYLPCFGDKDSITAAPDDIGLLMSYDKRHLLALGDERYLIGPAILYDVDAYGEETSLSAVEIYLARLMVETRTVTICVDGKDFPALRLD